MFSFITFTSFLSRFSDLSLLKDAIKVWNKNNMKGEIQLDLKDILITDQTSPSY